MSDIIVIEPDENNVVVSEVTNSITTASNGPQGPAGPTGATGATGATGPAGSSGVVAVTAPITNSGTSSSANIGISAGTTSAAGALQLTDSVASTSTTTAATPNAVKTAYDSLPNLTKISGQYYRTPVPINSAQNTTHNRMFLSPIFFNKTTSLDRIGSVSSGSFAGTSTVRFGIYSDLNGFPNTLVLDAGTATFTAASQGQQITINQSVNTGFYWLAFCQQGTAPGIGQYLGVTGNAATVNYLINGSISLGGLPYQGYEISSITGSLPSTIPTATLANNMIYTWVRTSS